jgi:hypothetical protein
MAPALSPAAIRFRVMLQMLGGTTVVAIPIGLWWYRARADREEWQSKFHHRIILPGSSDAYDYVIAEQCRPGDVLLFHRKCETCATSPWAAASCYITQYTFGNFNHCGLIVPGYGHTKAQALDPTNLLVLEATPSGIVARPLKDRLEQSTSNCILLLPVATPGERRDRKETTADPSQSIQRMHRYANTQLAKFRDEWVAAGETQGYRHFHSTVSIGGALAYQLGVGQWMNAPVSPAAYLVLTGLQKAAIAMNTNETENQATLVTGFLRDYRRTDTNVVRLRPGYRFLPPVTLKQGNTSTMDD